MISQLLFWLLLIYYFQLIFCGTSPPFGAGSSPSGIYSFIKRDIFSPFFLMFYSLGGGLITPLLTSKIWESSQIRSPSWPCPPPFNHSIWSSTFYFIISPDTVLFSLPLPWPWFWVSLLSPLGYCKSPCPHLQAYPSSTLLQDILQKCQSDYFSACQCLLCSYQPPVKFKPLQGASSSIPFSLF